MVRLRTVYLSLTCSPVASVRNPERWKDPQQREKALAEQKEMEELRKQQEEKEAQEEKKRQTAKFWRKLELCAESEDIARQIGASGFMTKLLYENGLVADVARVLDYDIERTMFVINHGLHLALTSKATYLAKPESNSVKFIGIGCCSSQRASEHFNSMGQSLQLSQRMSKYRMECLVSAGDQVSVDGTFLDCNSTQISAAKVGKRKNGTYGQQINFALLVNSSSGLPVGYRWYSGDTHDVTTLDDLVEMWIDNGFQKKKAEFVWDRGYFDKERMQRFDQEGFRYISGAKVGLKAIKEIIDTYNSEFYSANSLLEHHYCHGKKVPIYGTKDNGEPEAVGYLYFSPNKYMAEIRSLRKELEEAQKKWRDGKLNKNASILDLFEPPEEGKELVLNEKRFEDECYLRGFFACVSSTDQSLDELLDKYRLRNEVEVNFRLMLGDLHRTTRVQSSQSLDGMLLVTFVALSLLGNLRTMLKRKLPAHENIRAVNCDIMDFNEEYPLSDYYTISEMLTELKSVVAIRSHRTQQTRLINLTSKQKGLLKELGCEGLFDNADELWELMSAEHLASYIAAVKAQDELNAQAAQTTASADKA